MSDGFVAMAEVIKGVFDNTSLEAFVAGIQNSFNQITTSLGLLSSAFTFTGNTLKFFFNSFTLTVKTAGMAISSALTGIANGFTFLLDAVGADQW
jgi:hypothetical protein